MKIVSKTLIAFATIIPTKGFPQRKDIEAVRRSRRSASEGWQDLEDRRGNHLLEVSAWVCRRAHNDTDELEIRQEFVKFHHEGRIERMPAGCKTVTRVAINATLTVTENERRVCKVKESMVLIKENPPIRVKQRECKRNGTNTGEGDWAIGNEHECVQKYLDVRSSDQPETRIKAGCDLIVL